MDGVRARPPVDPARRFGGLDRLYGPGTWQALARVHVVVAGLGGVGTWCAEALARSGVGRLTLVDLDHVAESNINRQVHALDSTLGQSKVLAMAARVADINPLCEVHCVDDFLTAANVEAVLGAAHAAGPALLVDCTDQVRAKVAMVLQARALRMPMLCCGGAGGKLDALALSRGDLSQVRHDALLAHVRARLRRHHGYPAGGPAQGGTAFRKVPPMRVPCLWFNTPVVLPAAWQAAGQAPAADPAGPEASTPALQGLSCAGYGSVVTVTAALGLAAAQWALQQGRRLGLRAAAHAQATAAPESAHQPALEPAPQPE